MTARAILWREADVPVHLGLIDGALDDHDMDLRDVHDGMTAMENRLKNEMQAGFEKCDNNDAGTRRLLISLLVSIVLLAIATLVGVLVAVGGGTP